MSQVQRNTPLSHSGGGMGGSGDGILPPPLHKKEGGLLGWGMYLKIGSEMTEESFKSIHEIHYILCNIINNYQG